LVGFID